MGELVAETFSGTAISFSDAAYNDAMDRYTVKDIEAFVKKLERKKPWETINPAVADFFRDFAAVQEQDHPDFDRGVAIGGLAARIELAVGQIPEERMDEALSYIDLARVEYDIAFG